MKKTIVTILCLFVVIPAFASTQKKGYIVSWGKQVIGVDLSGEFADVAAGADYSLGLKADGSIVAKPIISIIEPLMSYIKLNVHYN